MCVMLYLYFKNSRFFFMGIFITAFIYNYWPGIKYDLKQIISLADRPLT
jgi:hypothetical protein